MIATSFYVGLGGFLGAISRYLACKWVAFLWPHRLYAGTLTVNITGSLLIGFLLGLEVIQSQGSWRLFLTTGFLGSLTTFSTFSFETVRLLQAGQLTGAGWHIGLNLLGSVSAAALGLWFSSLI